MNSVRHIIAITLLFSPLLTYPISQQRWAEQTLASMSVDEKIGQLFMVATASDFNQPEEALASALIKCPYQMDHEHIKDLITNYHVGGIIYLFKSTPEKQMDLTNELQKLSKHPLLIGQDCEWGLSMRLYDTLRFPRNMTLGAIQDEALIYEMGKKIGKQCSAIGVHINFSPVVDVNNNPANPVINDRSFGENKEKVARYAILMMRGLQDGGVMACAKHFPGHGDTSVDSHSNLPVITHTRSHLNNTELYPFKKLIAQGVDAVMNAHLCIPTLEDTPNMPSSLSHKIVTELLQEELGFKGLVITDGLGMSAITKHYAPGDIELKALLAGNDIILCPLDVPKAVELIKQAIQNKQLSTEVLDAHVAKILQAKEKMNLHRNRFVDKHEAYAAWLNNDYGLELKKKLFAAAITKASVHDILPVKATENDRIALIKVGGRTECHFKNMLLQECPCADFLLASKPSNDEVEKIAQNVAPYKHIIIALFDMNKFAHQNWGVSEKTLELIRILESQGKKITLVLFGNPYSLRLFNRDKLSIIEAYEDDADAQRAAAQVILGTLKPQGKLPVTPQY
ncbi:MAG: hypothetical protein NTX86_03345 [Candidatus Dependentiae bacterium]|nr:hypothetical protein [Candidatus Dependentiae bacterium]